MREYVFTFSLFGNIQSGPDIQFIICKYNQMCEKGDLDFDVSSHH